MQLAKEQKVIQQICTAYERGFLRWFISLSFSKTYASLQPLNCCIWTHMEHKINHYHCCWYLRKYHLYFYLCKIACHRIRRCSDIDRKHVHFTRKLGPASISDTTSYCKISHSLKAARFVFRIVLWLRNLTVISVTIVSWGLSNFKAMW